MNRFVCRLHETTLISDEHVFDKRCLEKISEDVKRLEYTTDRGVIASLIKRCGNAKALTPGRQLQAHMSTTRHFDDIFLMNLLIEMYGKCNSVDDARLVFHEIYEKNIFSWTIMLAAYAENGHYTQALQVLWKMDQEGIRPNGFTFVSIIGACNSLLELRTFHERVLAMELEDLVLDTVLLNAYGRCGSAEDARAVFDTMSERNLVSWNAMIATYAQHGQGYEALQLFRDMDLEGLKHNKITFINTITACTSTGDLKQGEMIHKRVLASRFDTDAVVSNTLLNMYGKCRSLVKAREVFDSIPRKTRVSWSAMIAAYALNGHNKEALELYKEMDKVKLTPDRVIYLNLLDACASIGHLEEGRRLHEIVTARGFESDFQMCNSLMNMYGKCGGLDQAMEIFKKLPKPTVISWNTMIAAYAQSGHAKPAVEMFRRMNFEGVKPDKITFMSVLEAIAANGDLREGKQIHAMVSEFGFSADDTSVSNSLLNMYAKCGSMSDAVSLFGSMPKPDQVSWTCVIAGYAQHGHNTEALEFYQKMDLEGAKPNQVTFLSILTACTHAGLLEDGAYYFMSMTSDHGVEATQEHYGCVVDLLGRAGWLDEAEKIISKLPDEPCAIVWTSLLGGCCLHRDVERAERVVGRVVEKEPGESGAYVLLSNLYAAEERWEDVARMRDLIDEFCTVKETKPVSDARRRKLRAIRALESASRTKP